jgi:hypothetical protein
MRVLICVVLGLGAAYGFLIFTTLSRFGSSMDRDWRLRAEAFYAPQMPHTTATSLPPEYRAREHPEAEGPSTTRPTEPGQDHSGLRNSNRDQNIVGTTDSASESSNLPPAYPPTPNPTTYPLEKSSRESPLLPSSPQPATRRSSWQHHYQHSHSGRTNTLKLAPPPRDPFDSSPQQPQTYTGGQSSDDQKSPDESEERGRSKMAHSRSRSNLQS